MHSHTEIVSRSDAPISLLESVTHVHCKEIFAAVIPEAECKPHPMVSIADSSSWRLIERSSYTSVTKKITTTTEPIDCDDYTSGNCRFQAFYKFTIFNQNISDYQSESHHNSSTIPVNLPSKNNEEEEIYSASSTSSTRTAVAPTCFTRFSHPKELGMNWCNFDMVYC